MPQLREPDQELLSGVRGFSPPSFRGLIGLDPRGDAVVIGTETGGPESAIVLVAHDADAEARARSSLRLGLLEWTRGWAPDGRTWRSGTDITVGRISDLDGVAQGVLVCVAHTTDIAAARAEFAIHGVTATIWTLGSGDTPGRAVALAALAALDALPPAGTELSLDRVVESGAPLAVWRPRPYPASTRLETHADSVIVGDAVLRHPGPQVILEQGAFALGS